MKVLILHHLDGSSRVACVVPRDFSVWDWVMSRLEAFNLLGVGSVEERILIDLPLDCCDYHRSGGDRNLSCGGDAIR